MGLRELHLFAGSGGGILGSELLGFHPVAACEIDPYCRKILLQRQIDGIFPPFPIWDDVRTFDGKPFQGKVDIVSGGFPCQDISQSKQNAKGIEGSRSGLWIEMARIVREVRPGFVFVENSPALSFRGLGKVLGDLAEMGFDAEGGVLGARHGGAPHKRDRIWILAYTDRGLSQLRGIADDISCETEPAQTRKENLGLNADRDCGSSCPEGRKTNFEFRSGGRLFDETRNIPDAPSAGLERRIGLDEANARRKTAPSFGSIVAGSGRNFGEPWKVEPGLDRVAYGVADRVQRLRAIGNGQVPSVVRLAFETLIKNQMIGSAKAH